jgi:hypothetical protein
VIGSELRDFERVAPSAAGDLRRRSTAAAITLNHRLQGMCDGVGMRYFDIGALFGYHILAFTTLDASS